MVETTTRHPIQTDTWVKATWDEFVATAYSPSYQNGRAYFDQDFMRIEMASPGASHGQDHSILSTVVVLYGMATGLPVEQLINTSFRKTGLRECQPDLAYYLGANIPTLPRNNDPINVETFGPPALVIEVGATSFSDDLGAKRLLYEQLGVQEYWVVNTAEQEVIAFEVADYHSGRIETSQVLPNLQLSLVNDALQRSANEDTSTLGRWLLQSSGNS